MKLSRPWLLAPFAVWLAIAFPAVLHAQDDESAEHDEGSDDAGHDRARELLQHGEILPLAEIVARLSTLYPGDVLGVSLVRHRGRWLYRFKVLAPDGKLREVAIDAKTMEPVAEVEG